MKQPTELKRVNEEALAITWSTGEKHVLSSERLRKMCPCAECKEERGDESHQKPLTGHKKKSSLRVIESTKDEQIALKQIWAVGNYALGMKWADGHDTGIYTFDYLYELTRG